MGAVHQRPASFAPPAAVARVLSRFERGQLASFIEVAIDLLDLEDGDPDLEDDDPGGGNVEDEGEQAAWVEAIDQTRAGMQATAIRLHEDAEDDDPGGDPLDKGEMGDRPLYKTLPVYGINQTRGPLNQMAAYRAHLATLLTPRGHNPRGA